MVVLGVHHVLETQTVLLHYAMREIVEAAGVEPARSTLQDEPLLRARQRVLRVVPLDITTGRGVQSNLYRVAGTCRVVFGGGHAPVGWSVGFLRAPFDAVLRATIDWRRRLVPGVDVTELGSSFPDAFLALAPLETPPTREIVARTSGDVWTANVVNNHLGGDSFSWCGYLSGVLGCDAIEATHIPIDQYPYPTTAFTMTAPRASPPLNTLRHVHAGKYDSGRWEFNQDGDQQPFEQTERYAAKSVRDRFDREMLLAYLGAVGIMADDPAFWIGGTLLQNRVTFQPRTSTLEEVRRSYGIVR